MAADFFGRTDGEPILLLHGGGQTRHAWKGTAERLASAGYRAVTLDLRGHGESDWDPGGDYSIEAFVGDLRVIMSSFDRPVALVGASLGGLASMLCIGEGNSSVASALVLVDVTPRLDSDGVDKIVAFMRGNPQGFISIDAAAEAVATYLPHRPRPATVDGLRKNLRLDEDGRYRWHWDPGILAVRGVPREREAFARRVLAAASSLTLPTLLVRGQMSEVVNAETVREFLEAVPHAEYVDVDNAAHMVAGDRNDEFSSAVVDFLERVVPQKR